MMNAHTNTHVYIILIYVHVHMYMCVVYVSTVHIQFVKFMNYLESIII